MAFNADLKRLIPEFFLRSDRVAEFLDAITEWFRDNWDTVSKLLLAYDAEEASFAEAVELLGWAISEHEFLSSRIGDVLRFAIESWRTAGSRRFWQYFNAVAGSDYDFTDQSTSVMSYSTALSKWSATKRYQDADFYREAAFKLTISEADLLTYREVLQIFPAGCYVYRILRWGTLGADVYCQNRWNFQLWDKETTWLEVGERDKVTYYPKYTEIDYTIPHSNVQIYPKFVPGLVKDSLYQRKSTLYPNLFIVDENIPVRKKTEYFKAISLSRFIGDMEAQRPPLLVSTHKAILNQ